MTGSDPYLPGHGDDRYQAEHYALDLRYKPLGNHLEGRAELSVRAVVDLTDLVVDLHRLEVRSLRVEGAKVARWSHRGSRLRIRLTQALPAGEPLLLTIAYRGNPGTMPGPDGPAGWEELTDGVLVAEVKADAFCHSMVRALVGACVAVGEGRLDVDDLVVLRDALTRTSEFKVLAARGLILTEVGYPADELLSSRATQTRARRDGASG